jgi:predicted Zn-dependent peptidase
MASAGESRGPGLFRLGGMANPGRAIADLEQAIYAEIERLKAGPIEAWEIEKARNSAKRGFVGSLTSSLSRAVMLSQLAVYYDDPNLINTRYERLSAITAADVQRVANQYFTPQSRTVVITNPKAPAPAAGAPKGGLR